LLKEIAAKTPCDRWAGDWVWSDKRLVGRRMVNSTAIRASFRGAHLGCLGVAIEEVARPIAGLCDRWRTIIGDVADGRNLKCWLQLPSSRLWWRLR
jgi:hypothetical protein